MIQGTTLAASGQPPAGRPTPARTPWGAIVVVVVLALLAWLHLYRAVQTASVEPTDFRTYFMASEDALAGRNPYTKSEKHLDYIYPPLLLWLCAPLTKLPFLVAVAVWTLVNFLAWIGAVCLTLKIVNPRRAATWILIVVPSLACYRWILQASTRGQLNLIVLLVTLAGLWAAERRKEWLSGSFLAMAIHLKLLPILFLPYFILRTRWKVVASCFAVGVILLVLPGVTYGREWTIQMLRLWLQRFLQHGGALAMDMEGGNQAPLAMMYRFLARRDVPPVEWFPPPVASLPPETVWLMYTLVAVTVYSVTLWLSNRSHPFAPAAADFSLLFLSTHLVSKKTFEHHLVTMIFVYSALLAIVPGWRGSPRRAATAWWGLWGAIILQNFYSPMFLGLTAASRIGVYSPTTLSLILLWSVLVMLKLDRSKG